MSTGDFDASAWYRIATADDPVRQGDQLFDITLRVVVPSDTSPGSFDIGEYTADVIVATQSCDLEQAKVAQVEVIPIYPIAEWLADQPGYFNQLDSIRRGHVPAAYLLPGWPAAPVEGARTMRMVPFDEKRSISWRDLEEARQQPRLGLRSPYIEHFGQAVARFYMRVGLPEDLPEIDWRPADEGGKAEHLTLTPERFEVMDLPRPSAPVDVRVQRVSLVGREDTLYRAALQRDGSFLGFGDTSTAAIESLQRFLVHRRNQLASQPIREGGRPHWLMGLFPE